MSEKLYFLYARVSKDDYLASLQTQLKMLKNKANEPQNNFKYSQSTVKGEDESGSVGRRSKFGEMISLLMEDSQKPPKDRQYAGVLFFKLDRLFRNSVDFHQVEILMDKGYKFISATETIENTPTWRLLFRMLAGFAIYESDKLSSRVTLTYLMNTLKNQFDSLGWKLIIGYEMKEMANGTKVLSVVQEEKELIDFIYTLRSNELEITAQEIFEKISGIPYYKEILERIIRTRSEKNAKSKEKSVQKRKRIESMIENVQDTDVETDDVSQEEVIEFDINESPETNAVRLIQSCLRNESKYRYDGHFTKTIYIRDELIQSYLRYIASLDEDQFENEFENNTAEWDKTTDEIGEKITFQFFIPELVIVENKKYTRVQESIFRKDKGLVEKVELFTLFDWLMYVKDGHEDVPMNHYISKKWTINYRRHVNWASVEKSEMIIEKSILRSPLFENHDNIMHHKDLIMECIELASRRSTTKIVRRETMRRTVYLREIRSLSATLDTIMGMKKPDDLKKNTGLFDMIKREIETYEGYVRESEEALHNAERDNRNWISFFFHLLTGKIEELEPVERKLAYIAMFEKIVMSTDKERITIHLRQHMAHILWVPKEFDISLM